MTKSQGLSLLDIAPASEMIKIGEQEMPVYGISVKGVISLLQRFPMIQTWVSGGKLDPAKLLEMAPEALAAVIALGCRVEGEVGEQEAAKLSIETQIDIVEAIGRLTFSNGFGPFAQRILKLANLGAAVSQNYGRAPDTISQPQSSNSEPSGEPAPAPSGN